MIFVQLKRIDSWIRFFQRTSLVAAISAAVLVLSSVPQRALFPYAWDYAEPVVALSVLELGERPLIYQAFAALPYRVFAYNPLYVYASSAVRPLWEPVWAGGRFISAAACVVIALTLLRMARKAKATFPVALAVSLGWLCLPVVFTYQCTLRPDLLALAWTALGLLSGVAVRGDETYALRRRSAAAAGVCFALAFLTRQNFIFAPTAYLLTRCTQRGRRSEGLWAVGTAAAIALPVMAFYQVATAGAYLDNVVVFNMQPYYPQLVLRTLARHLPTHWPVYLLSLAALPVLWKEGRSRLLAVYLLLVCAEILMVGRIGSDENYFLEPVFGAYLAVAWFVASATGQLRAAVLWPILTAALTLLVPYHLTKRAATLESTVLMQRNLEPVRAFLSTLPGEVVSEEMGLLIASGRRVPYQFFEATQLADRGLFDDGPFIERIRRQEFTLILASTNLLRISRSQRFRPGFIAAVRSSYTLRSGAEGLLWFVPKRSVQGTLSSGHAPAVPAASA